MECVHLVNQGRYKIDVAVRIRDRERQITARDDLPIGGAAIVGVGQRLGVNKDEAFLVSGIPQIPDGQLVLRHSCASVKTQHQRHLLGSVKIHGDVLHIRSRLSIHDQGFGGELRGKRGSKKDPNKEQARSGFNQDGQAGFLDHQGRSICQGPKLGRALVNSIGGTSSSVSACVPRSTMTDSEREF